METKYKKIQQTLSKMKQPDYRYLQITDAVFKQRIGEFEHMTMLPMALRDALINELGNTLSSVAPAL